TEENRIQDVIAEEFPRLFENYLKKNSDKIYKSIRSAGLSENKPGGDSQQDTVIELVKLSIEITNKRFEELIHYIDKRFEAVDKRFEDMNKRMNFQTWLLGLLMVLTPTLYALMGKIIG
ncbi:MAG: hypothetical protein B0D92_01025, partial [Spirochaeta sp. LUC14_002_19_P3]